MEVFITRSIPEIGIDYLKKNGFKVKINKKDKALSKKELISNIKNSDAVISLLSDKIDKEIIDGMKKCKIIANYAVGFNNIDIEYAKSKNIIVTNTPDVLTDSTADLAFTLLLAAARRMKEGEKLISKKKFKGWEPKLLLGIELNDKVLGIVGAGRIGSAVAKRAQAFGMKIIYNSRTKNLFLEKELKAKKVTLNNLLKKSDFISLHVPLTDKTFHLINKQNLKLLKKRSVFINTARGEIVDEKELIKLLKRKKIFAAGFDVYENEPKINPELLKLDNVILLPHLGSGTFEARNEMSLLAAKNILSVLKGKSPITPV